MARGAIAQLVERLLCKQEVAGSRPAGSIIKKPQAGVRLLHRGGESAAGSAWPTSGQNGQRGTSTARITWAVLAVFVVALVVAVAGADAHTLTKREAALTSRLELSEYADHRCDLRASCEFASYPHLTKYDCVRRSPHAVLCGGWSTS